MDEQAQASTQERLTAFFSPKPEGPAETPPEPVAASETTEEVQTEEVQDDGLDDFDDEGTVYRIPRDFKAKVAEWKDGHLRREDYTRKTQDLADLHRQAQLQAEAIQRLQHFDKEVANEKAELSQVQAELKRYKDFDWGSVEDANTFQRLKHQQSVLKERQDELKGLIDSKGKELDAKIGEHRTKIIEEGQKYLARSIQGFNQHTIKASQEGALGVGYTGDELKNVYDARFVHMAWKAAQYDKLQSAKTEAVSQVQKAPPVIKPGAVVPGAAQERQVKTLRDNLKKTGSMAAAQELFKQIELRNDRNRSR